VKLSEVHALIEKFANTNDPQRLHLPTVREGLRETGQLPLDFYQELEMDSPFADTHEDVSPNREEVQLHSHSFYEILYICGGNVQYLLGSKRYSLQRGDVVIVPPGESHCPLFLEPLTQPYRRYVIWLSEEFVQQAELVLPELVSGCLASGLLRTGGTQWELILREAFQQGCSEAARKDVGWQAFVCGNSMRLMAYLQRAAGDYRDKKPAAERRELLDELLDCIEQNYAEKITLENMARRFLVSESSISQLFRSKMGVSFYRCVTQRRLIAAKNLILQGEPLESLHMQVGFGDYSTFYRAFKHEYGISPREFRKMHQK
jgi:AraC-like DNA-binding protein/mannose-6-phosphate isomerase-like protein (cupin superfamily)